MGREGNPQRQAVSQCEKNCVADTAAETEWHCGKQRLSSSCFCVFQILLTSPVPVGTWLPRALVYRSSTKRLGAKGCSSVKEERPTKNWRYRFSCICCIVSSLLRFNLCLINIAPMTRWAFLQGRPVYGLTSDDNRSGQ